MPWHTDPAQDLEARRQMINLIANYLEKRHPKTAGAQDALVASARKLEVALYKACKTKQEYMETRTLARRIRELERSGQFSIENTLNSSGTSQPASTNIPTSSTSGTALNTSSPPAQAANDQAIDSGAGSTNHSNPASSTPSAGDSLSRDGQSNLQSSAAPATHAEVLKQRRTRLQMLKHAARCKDERCPHSWCPHMKRLWDHVSKCKTTDCQFPHCISSHYVLNHYHRCRDPDCPVCSYVRDPAAKKKLEQQRAANGEDSLSKGSSTGAQVTIYSGRGASSPDTMTANKKMLANAASVSIDPRYARGARDGTGPSLPLSMTRGAVQQHLDSLRVEQLQQAFFPLLRKLMENVKCNNGLFNFPVTEDQAPGYSSIITSPMDFGTIRRRLEDGKYRRPEDFEKDVLQVFKNAMTFNNSTQRVHRMAVELKQIFDADFKKIKQKLAEPIVPRKNGQCTLCKEAECAICILCSRACIPYEPKIIYCSGGCENPRIQRNDYFYSLPGSSLNWCQSCHDKRKAELTVSDVTTGNQYQKLDLIKRRHDELFGESWVACDVCQRWVHQTCALFNSRKQNPHEKEAEKYTCPDCLIKHEYATANKVPGAEDLEQTRLSVFLEMWVRTKLTEALQQEKMNPSKIKGEDPPPASAVTIRVLSNHNETFHLKQYAKKVCGFPDALTYRSRAIFLFQHLDGVDVLLFVMYVQEYGSDAPPPNRNKLYIAYLDSVHFFRPRHFRTLVYHELLLAYMEYARRQGFTSCYIWACPPPTKKDDYILHCHPEDQRVPSAERLRVWYHEMIKRGVSQRIILSSCALFEEHYEASFKKANVNQKKKDVKKGDGKTKKASHRLPNGDATKAGLAAEADAAPSLNVGSGPALPDDDDVVFEDFNFDDLTGPGSAPTPAPTSSTTPGPDSGAATPARRATASPATTVANGGGESSKDKDDGPLFLGTRKGDLEAMDEAELEKRRQHKLAIRFQMPVFDGDYWPNEMEDVALDQARKAREGKGGKGSKAGVSTRKASDVVTMDNLVASGEINQIDSKTVLNRIGESLEAMRADFLVVKLAHECSICGDYLHRGRWECRHPDCLKAAGFNRPSPFALCNSCFADELKKPAHKQHGGEVQLGSPVETCEPNGPSEGETKMEVVEEISQTADQAITPQPEADIPKVKQEPNPGDVLLGGSSSANDQSPSSEGQTVETKPPPPTKEQLAEWIQQPLECTRIKPEPAQAFTHQLVYVDEGLPLNTPRSDKVFKNHLLETRHAFLSLCTGNRYAFNQLRRAKHTTMMILYHLHNPDAPAHLHSCNNCNQDIIAGYRYNCAICSGGDYDLCDSCAFRVNHQHKLTKYEVTRTVDQEVSESKRKKGMEKRRQRKRSLQVFLNALVHASSCPPDSECQDVACAKMKELLAHRNSCKVRVRGGCEICRRVLCLVQMHAKGTDNQAPCTKDNCSVPHCDDLKRHLKQKHEEEQRLAGANPSKTGAGTNGHGTIANGPKGKKNQGTVVANGAVASGAATTKGKKKTPPADGPSGVIPPVPAQPKSKKAKAASAGGVPVASPIATGLVIPPPPAAGGIKVKLKRPIPPPPAAASQSSAKPDGEEPTGKRTKLSPSTKN